MITVEKYLSYIKKVVVTWECIYIYVYSHMLYINIDRLYHLFTYDIYKYSYFTPVITNIHMNIVPNYFPYVE